MSLEKPAPPNNKGYHALFAGAPGPETNRRRLKDGLYTVPLPHLRKVDEMAITTVWENKNKMVGTYGLIEQNGKPIVKVPPYELIGLMELVCSSIIAASKHDLNTIRKLLKSTTTKIGSQESNWQS